MASDVKVSSKYQVVIPKEIREKINLEKGDELQVSLQGDTIVMRVKPRSFTEYSLGLHKEVWEGEDTDEYTDRMRDGWEPPRRE